MTRDEFEKLKLLQDAVDPSGYVPLPEHERALSTIREALESGTDRIVLLGPPGFGKSLVLRRFEMDPPLGTRLVYLPFANLDPDEFAPWLLSWMGADAAAPLSEDEFVTWVRVEGSFGRRHVLLLDEAQSLPVAAAKRLNEWVTRAGGALQIVLAGLEGEELEAVLSGFSAPPQQVALRRSLRGEALRCFADTLVHRIVGNRGDAPTWLWDELELVRLTDGVPRLIKSELRKRLEDVSLRPKRVAEKDRVEAAQQVALGAVQTAKPRSPAPVESVDSPESDEPYQPAEPENPLFLQEALALEPPPRRLARLVAPAVALSLLACAPLWPLFQPAGWVQPTAPTSPSGSVASAPASELVMLRVDADPSAEIRIDGEAAGTTPLAGLEIEAGLHELVAVFPDGRELKKSVELRAPSTRVHFP